MKRSADGLIFLALLAALLVAPFLVYPVFLIKVLCFALFACAFNLLIGYVGLLSFGHAMFFGFGSYVSAHLLKSGTIMEPLSGAVITLPQLTPEWTLLAALIVTGCMGFIVGLIAIRRQGIYFAMVTLALAQMIYFLCVKAPFTGGEDGIQGVPRRRLFGIVDTGNDLALYYVVLAVFVIGFLIIYRTIHSPFGQVLKAIRENEPRAVSLGYRVDQYKLLAFVISAALAGLAGATKSLVFPASLTDVQWQMSGEVVLMTLVGGMGTILGPGAGAAVIVAMQDYLKGLGEWVLVIQGAIFVVTVLLFRRGVVGELAALVKRFGGAAATK